MKVRKSPFNRSCCFLSRKPWETEGRQNQTGTQILAAPLLWKIQFFRVKCWFVFATLLGSPCELMLLRRESRTQFFRCWNIQLSDFAHELRGRYLADDRLNCANSLYRFWIVFENFIDHRISVEVPVGNSKGGLRFQEVLGEKLRTNFGPSHLVPTG